MLAVLQMYMYIFMSLIILWNFVTFCEHDPHIASIMIV